MQPNTKPIWQDIAAPEFPALQRDEDCDVVVVGAGIAGLTTAYLLKNAGLKVIVLERDFVGAGDSGHTTAHLTYVTDERLRTLAKKLGEDAVRLAWYGGVVAIDLIERICLRHEIDCNFHRIPGFLHGSLDSSLPSTESFIDDVRLAQQFGLDAEFVERVPVVEMPGVCFHDQAKFHPMKYLQALAQLVDGHDCKVYQQTEVTDVEDEELAVVCDRRRIRCNHLVIATHVPLAGKAGLVTATMLQTKLASYSSYVVSGTVERGIVPEVMTWDTSDPYYYLRIDAQDDSDRVIFGGEDHKTGQVIDTDERYDKLSAKLQQLVPTVYLDRRWSGQVVVTQDGLPYIGETAANQYVATGFNGNGYTWGTLAGLLFHDAILKRMNPWSDLLSVSRKPLHRGAWGYLVENMDYPFYLIADSLIPLSRKGVADLKAGEGDVFKIDGQRVACARSMEGELHAVSAVCTHLGCLVRWNKAEQTWDCPCHGSRFQATGEVISGPAETPLENRMHVTQDQ